MIEGVSVYWAHPLLDYWFLGGRYNSRLQKRKTASIANG